MVPGPPFVFGSLLVMCALLVSVFIPENITVSTDLRHKHIGKFNYSVIIIYIITDILICTIDIKLSYIL